MKLRSVDAFSFWAHSTYGTTTAILAGTMYGGTAFIAGELDRSKHTLIMRNFIAMPRGIGTMTEVLTRIEMLLPDMHLKVCGITNERFGKYLVEKRHYEVTGKGEVTLPASVGVAAINRSA